MNGLSLDLRLVLRGLRKAVGLFGVALLTIALGVGANTAMFSVVNAVMVRPLPYPEPSRLVSLWPEKRWSLQMLDDVRARVTSYEDVSAYRQGSYVLLGDGAPEAVSVAAVSPSHFAVLAVAPLRGRGFVAGDAAADPWVLGGVALLLALVAGLAALVPAARAARLSPVSALQAE